MTVCYILTDEELNIIVDKEELKPEGTNMQTTTMAVFPTEESVSRLGLVYRGSKVFQSTFSDILITTSVQSLEKFFELREFAKTMKVIIVGFKD